MNDLVQKEQLKQWVLLAQKGDQSASGKLIEQTQQKLYKFCLLLGRNREQAEELCQETYIKALLNLNKLSKPEAFQAWLYQMAKNLFIDLKRSRLQNEQVSEEGLLADHGESKDPQYEEIFQVRRALSQFEPEDRYLILLIELEGYSYSETADLLGVTEDSVRSKLHRLRHLFLKYFNSGETK